MFFSKARRTELGILTSVTLVLGSAAWLGCGPADPVPAPVSAPPTGLDTPKAKAPDPDPLQALLGTPDTKPAPRFTLPELPFEEHATGLPTSGTWIGYPLAFDFTGDGRADIVASNREEDGYSTWEYVPKGPWVRHIEGLPRDMAYGPACAADANGDKIPDLILSAHTDALRVYLNDGKMNWTRATPAIDNPILMLDIAIGNLNGDGFPDCAGVAHFEGGLGLYVGDGQGGFQRLPESKSVIPTRTFGKDIELFDLDGNGLDDIVVQTNDTSAPAVKVLLNQKPKAAGDPLTFEERSAGLPMPSIGNSLTAVRVGRFRAGGWPQIVVCGLADPGVEKEKLDTIGVYAWSPTDQSWSHIDHGIPRWERYRDAACADLDGDSNLDLVLMSIDSGGVVMRGDGQGGFEAIGRLAGVHGKGRLSIADVDGDKRPDIVVSIPATKENPTVGGVRCFLNRPEVWLKR